eukprot:GEMP01023228.1.p1 GENE.GEMP01023228.1~~GEMP01023228.1.p1  ORF type:complete len:557 (+),score=199.73 GEMP01023228.1:257-1927(+)
MRFQFLFALVVAQTVPEDVVVAQATTEDDDVAQAAPDEGASLVNGSSDLVDLSDPTQVHTANAQAAAQQAKQAANVANVVATHAKAITANAQDALMHAHKALQGAADTAKLGVEQKKSLDRAAKKLKEATEKTEYGELKQADWLEVKKEEDGLSKRLEELQEKLKHVSSQRVEQDRTEIQSQRDKLQELRELYDAIREKASDANDSQDADEADATRENLEDLQRQLAELRARERKIEDHVQADVEKTGVERSDSTTDADRARLEKEYHRLQEDLTKLRHRQELEKRIQKLEDQLRQVEKSKQPDQWSKTELARKIHQTQDAMRKTDEDAEETSKMERELKELEEAFQKLQAGRLAGLPAAIGAPTEDSLKAKIEQMSEALDRLRAEQADQQKRTVAALDDEHPTISADGTATAMGDKPLPSGHDSAHIPGQSLPQSEGVVPSGGVDIDTSMPFGQLEPFGREDTAQELTESSINESDKMVDQLERAEVSEEKRSVFRALTRLRGAAITSFDGVARSQTGNIDEYNKIHKWRKTHPLHHLAAEESDISKWAFPGNAD